MVRAMLATVECRPNPHWCSFSFRFLFHVFLWDIRHSPGSHLAEHGARNAGNHGVGEDVTQICLLRAH